METELEFRVIKLTDSALSHGRINIRACGREFFPPEAFGNSSRARGGGARLCLRIKGLTEPVMTDIPTDAAGRPRWFFRERAWVKPFIQVNSLSAGAQVLIRRLTATEYEVAPLNGAPPQETAPMLPGFASASDGHRRVSNGHIRGQRGKNGDLNKLAPEDRPVHDWYRFVLSYPPHLVREYLRQFAISGDQLVLDPFCGTGTTVVECQKQGIRAVGIEANPMAAFASATKCDWRPDANGLLRHARKIADLAVARLKEDGIEDNPFLEVQPKPAKPLRTLDAERMGLLLSDCISPLPLHKTLVLLEVMEQHADAEYAAHERLALAKALVYSISNLHFGPEVGVGPAKPDCPVVAAWLQCVQAMARDLATVQRTRFVQAVVHHADARNLSDLLEPASVSAVITSPPYPNEKDYTRTTRLESVLLGFIRNNSELRSMKRSLIRSNTRGVYKADDDDKWIADVPEIAAIADAIERRRLELGKTSGFERLYARVTKLYFGGMWRHLSQLTRVLKPGAHLAYVVGDQASYLRIMIRTGELLGRIAQAIGYELVGRDLFRTRLATATRQQLREEVVVLRWPGSASSVRKSTGKRSGPR